MEWWKRALLLGALLFIAVATLTPGRGGSVPGIRPSFTCLACGTEGGADVTLNIVLFLPLGIALALLGKSPIRALFIGALLSGFVEFAQRAGFPPGRVANVTDLLTNSAGTLVGAMIAWHFRRLVRPAPAGAALLAAFGTIVIASFLALIGWSLGRDPAIDDGAAGPMKRSGLAYTSGFGWYHGRVSHVLMDGRIFPHRGDGPVMLFGTPEQEMSGEVAVIGRDERSDLVPMLYVHGHRAGVPEMLLGQHGNRAELQVRLRGSRLRLPGPRLQLVNAFTLDGDSARVLRFDVTPQKWQLISEQAGATERAALPISLSLGWTLFQTVVHVGDITGTIVTVTWMLLLWIPIGYWCALAGAGVGESGNIRRWQFVAAGTAALIAILHVVPRSMEISPTLSWEWAVSLAGLATGVFFGTAFGRATPARLQ